MARQQTLKQAKVATGSEKHLYTFEVLIVSGPLAPSFVKKNKVISRTIQMRGDQTLEQLHQAIFSAFEREEEHMYEFQVGGKGPMDPQARRYVLGLDDGDAGQEARAAGDVERTTIGMLGAEGERGVRLLVRLWRQLVASDQRVSYRGEDRRRKVPEGNEAW
ncbi:MAG: hypothetical protein WKF84_02885 [Pyrinomonadaceae bacterium]